MIYRTWIEELEMALFFNFLISKNLNMRYLINASPIIALLLIISCHMGHQKYITDNVAEGYKLHQFVNPDWKGTNTVVSQVWDIKRNQSIKNIIDTSILEIDVESIKTAQMYTSYKYIREYIQKKRLLLRNKQN